MGSRLVRNQEFGVQIPVAPLMDDFDDEYCNLYPDLDRDYHHNSRMRLYAEASWDIHEYYRQAICREMDKLILESLWEIAEPKPKPIFSEPFRYLEGLNDGS